MRFAPFLLAAAVGLAYSNSFAGVFVFDDVSKIAGNPQLTRFRTAVTATSRPLLQASYWLNYAVDGMRPAVFHLFNLGIHLASVLLLFGIIRRVLRDGRFDEVSRSRSDGMALAVALLWGLHPLATGAVTYLAQRAESMMSMFYLLTVYAAVRAATGDRRGWKATAIAACWGGMAVKEVMITAPVAVMLVDRAFFYGNFRVMVQRRWRFYAGLFSAWLLLAGVMLVRRWFGPVTFYAWRGTTAWQYLLTQSEVIVHYLRLIVWPHPLCLDYRWPTATGFGDVWPEFVALSLLAIGLLTLWFRKPALALPGLWFFLILAPSSSLAPRPDNAFEHRVYLPMAGIVTYLVGCAWWVADCWRVKPPRRRVVMGALFAVAALLLGTATYDRNRDFHSEVALWRSVVAVRPDNLRARNDLAVALAEAGRMEDAFRQIEALLDRIPDDLREDLRAGRELTTERLAVDTPQYAFFRAHANRGAMRLNAGDPAAALRDFILALRVLPEHDGVRARARGVLREQGVPEEQLDRELDRRIGSDAI